MVEVALDGVERLSGRIGSLDGGADGNGSVRPVPGVALVDLGVVRGVLETVGAELPHRLQEPEANLAPIPGSGDHGLVDQAPQRIQSLPLLNAAAGGDGL